jgi:hypothetical protein
MNNKSIIGAMIIFLFSPVINAAVVTWTFSGTITSNGGSTIGTVPGINVGDAVTGTAVYNTNASPIDLSWGATLYELTMSTDVLIIEVNGLTFSSTPGDYLSAVVSNDGTIAGEYGDRVTVSYQTDNSWVHVNIQDEVAPYDLITDQSLPTYLDFTKANEMPGWDGNYGAIQIGFTEGDIQLASFSIDSFETSAVPIPPAIWLFGSGLVGLFGIAKRGKSA